MDKLFLNIEETAEYLNVPKFRVYQLVKLRDFPAKKIGKSWRIHREILDRWAYRYVKQ